MFGLGEVLFPLIAFVEFILPTWGLIHVTRTRPDAFVAANKQTKKFWTILLGVTALFALAFQNPFGITGLAALIAGIVYHVDVRPAVTEVQRGRW